MSATTSDAHATSSYRSSQKASTTALLSAQVRAELLKLSSVRSTLAVAALLIALEALFKIVSIVLLDPSKARVSDVIFALKPSITYPVLAATLGVLLASAEWRYGTAGPTYAVQPRRSLVLTAKALVAAGTGFIAGSLATLIATGAALAVAARRGLPTLGAGEVAEIALGSIAGAGVLAVLGVTAGTLLRNQVAALAVAVGVLFVLAPLAALLSPEVYAWTPSGAVDALAAQQEAAPDLLGQTGGGLLLVGYAVALLACAASAVRRRDV